VQPGQLEWVTLVGGQHDNGTHQSQYSHDTNPVRLVHKGVRLHHGVVCQHLFGILHFTDTQTLNSIGSLLFDHGFVLGTGSAGVLLVEKRLDDVVVHLGVRAVDFVHALGTGNDNFPTPEQQEHNLGSADPQHKPGEQFGFVTDVGTVLNTHLVQFQRIAHTDGCHDVLHFEVVEAHVHVRPLQDASVLAARQQTLTDVFAAGTDHVAAPERQGGGLGAAQAHGHCRKSLRIVVAVL